MTLAAVRVAVGGDEHLRLDLAEPIEHALHAEVRRAGRPDRADRRSAQAPRQSLPAGSADSRRRDRRAGRLPAAAPSAKTATAVVQLGAGQRRIGRSSPLKIRAGAAPRSASRFSAKFSVASGKNAAPGIRSRSLDDALAHRSAHAAELPHQPPEVLRARDGELVEGGVVTDVEAEAGADQPA